MGVKWGPMGVQWDSLWAYADHSHFRVQTHMHRKALESIASGLIRVWWDPLGSHGGQVGFHVGLRGPFPLSCADPYA